MIFVESCMWMQSQCHVCHTLAAHQCDICAVVEHPGYGSMIVLSVTGCAMYFAVGVVLERDGHVKKILARPAREQPPPRGVI